MLHTETKNWCRMIISNFFLFSIEANTLPNDGRLGTRSAPDSERHFETDCEDALTGFASAVAQSMSRFSQQRLRELVKQHPYLPASLLADTVPSCSGGT